LANDFFQNKGEVRYARTLELPANRGRILDRNGLILAVSVPAPSDLGRCRRVSTPTGRAARSPGAGCWTCRSPKLDAQAGREDRTSSGCKRQVDDAVAEQVRGAGRQGRLPAREYRRQYPEGEAAAHVVGFTNVEDKGQEGIELRLQTASCRAAHGSRRVVEDRLGRVVEDMGEPTPASTARTCSSRIDCQGAVLRLPAACATRCMEQQRQGRQRGGAGRRQTGEVLALANYPSYDARQAASNLTRRAVAQPRPDRHLRARLDDEALRRRPGAGDRPRHARDHDPTPRPAARRQPAPAIT
jgi:cell division protein FtsI (penicillin-binding protein 3)